MKGNTYSTKNDDLGPTYPNSLTRRKALLLYLAGALGQILAVCVIIFILRRCGVTVDYTSAAGLIAVGIGGTSSALWGAVMTVRYKGYAPIRIVSDFFDVRQRYSSYLLVLFFLLLDFFSLFFGGSIGINAWYVPAILFLKALLFGGIEEIGWRYFFQPVMQEKRGYIVSTLITFLCWGIWHLAFFYIDGTLSVMGISDAASFLVGLFVNCFILSAMYIRTRSLWICVMTHALINVLSQITAGGNGYVRGVCCIVIIVIAVSLSKKDDTSVEGTHRDER